MTLHQWRKSATREIARAPVGIGQAVGGVHRPAVRLAQLQLENSRQRQLVTDLLRDTVKLEEVVRLWAA
jgi:hypothetical protein